MISFNNKPHYIGKPFTPEIKPIAYRLAHVNRYNGAVGTYSVAQHCVLVAFKLPSHMRLSGLLHDACEAYIGDVTSPVKRHIKGYQELEDFYLDEIDAYYGVETRAACVRDADLRMLITEVQSFGLDLQYFPDVQPYPHKYPIDKWSPKHAEYMFLRMFDECGGRT